MVPPILIVYVVMVRLYVLRTMLPPTRALSGGTLPRQSVGKGCQKSIRPWVLLLSKAITAFQGGFGRDLPSQLLWRGATPPHALYQVEFGSGN